MTEDGHPTLHRYSEFEILLELARQDDAATEALLKERDRNRRKLRLACEHPELIEARLPSQSIPSVAFPRRMCTVCLVEEEGSHGFDVLIEDSIENVSRGKFESLRLPADNWAEITLCGECTSSFLLLRGRRVSFCSICRK